MMNSLYRTNSRFTVANIMFEIISREPNFIQIRVGGGVIALDATALKALVKVLDSVMDGYSRHFVHTFFNELPIVRSVLKSALVDSPEAYFDLELPR